MGTILAVRKGDDIALGSDSWNLQEPSLNPQWCTGHGCIIKMDSGYLALNSSLSYQQAFEMALSSLDAKTLPALSTRTEIYEFFLRVHEILRNHYAMNVHYQQTQEFEWSPMAALLVNQSGIFKIDTNRSIYEFSRLWALGSSESIAIGAAEALYDSRKSASQIVQSALEVTCKMESLSSDAIQTVLVKVPKPKTGKNISSAKRKSSAKKKALRSVKSGKKK